MMTADTLLSNVGGLLGLLCGFAIISAATSVWKFGCTLFNRLLRGHDVETLRDEKGSDREKDSSVEFGTIGSTNENPGIGFASVSAGVGIPKWGTNKSYYI